MLEIRFAARLVLLDADHRVLLFKHGDGYGRLFWATPGGGVEEGESTEQAARREASEELGAKQVDLVPLWTGHTNFNFADRSVSQSEAFFLIQNHSGVLGSEVEETHRRERIVEIRWWSLDEIVKSGEVIYPLDLAARLGDYLRGAERR